MAYQQRAQQGAYRQASPYGQQAQGGWNGQPPMRNWEMAKKKKGHPVRNTLIVLLLIIIVIGGVGGFTGYTLYNSAKQVRSDASAVMSDISDLKAKIISDDPSQATATAADIAKRASNMKAETSGWEWTVASYVPVYGSDVAKVRELSNVFDDLAQNALVPLMGEVSQISLKNLFVDGGLNVEYTQRLVNAVDSAAPVIERCANTVENMGEANLEQVNSPLRTAKSTLGKLNTAAQFVDGIAPTFADMVGADGAPRTYLICAQQNSEVRSTGGMIGSVGSLTIDNGRMSLNDFRGVVDIYPERTDPHFEISDEEAVAFGSNASWVPSTTNYIPDWPRVSEILSYYWEQRGYGAVNGVIGVDPVFLQHILALTGPVTTGSGITVDGSNTASFLGHEVYFIDDTDLQDAIFTEIGAAAFQHLIGSISDVPLMTLVEQVHGDMVKRHLQIYMKNESEEEAMKIIGADGSLPTDETEPVLGVYANNDSRSKIDWYLKLTTEVDGGTKNSDGTTTYHAVTRLTNMIVPGEENESLSESSRTHNAPMRSIADMIDWVILSGPAGGYITNMNIDGYFSADSDYGMYEHSWKGIDIWHGKCQFLPGETVTLSYDVVVSAHATEPLKVVSTPTYQEVAGW